MAYRTARLGAGGAIPRPVARHPEHGVGAGPHCDPLHYWDVYFDITELSKKALDGANISIPFPQRDVHLYKHGA